MTNNNGFWIEWLDLLAHLYNYSQWQLLTHWTPSECPTNHSLMSDWSLFSNWVWVWVLYYDRRSTSVPWNEAPIWGLRPDFFINVRQLQVCLSVASLWQEDGSVVYSCCWPSAVQSFPRPSPAELITIFYCLRFETSSTCRARSPYLYPPWTGRPSYTPRHWVPFSSPPTTRRATVEVLASRWATWKMLFPTAVLLSRAVA
jgi:hypothetical protein